MKEEIFPVEYKEGFIKLLNPICPFVTEEIWNFMGHEKTISYEPWPKYDESKTIDDEIEIPVTISDDPMTVVAKGTAIVAAEPLALEPEVRLKAMK